MNSNIIGITGGIGCGKSTVTDLLAKQGIPIIDADIVAREVVEPNTHGLQKITDRFGQSILLADGGLNRAKLREIIFQITDEKAWLERLLHPIIRKEITQQLNDKSKLFPYVVLSSPLLLETDQHNLVSDIVVIDIDQQTQIERATKRDKNSSAQIESIIRQQIDRKSRLDKADYIINNQGNLQQLADEVSQLHSTLLSKYSIK